MKAKKHCNADRPAKLTPAIEMLAHYHLMHTPEDSQRVCTRLSDTKLAGPDIYIVSNPEAKAAFQAAYKALAAKLNKGVGELERIFMLDAPTEGGPDA